MDHSQGMLPVSRIGETAEMVLAEWKLAEPEARQMTPIALRPLAKAWNWMRLRRRVQALCRAWLRACAWQIREDEKA